MEDVGEANPVMHILSRETTFVWGEVAIFFIVGSFILSHLVVAA